MWKDGWLHMGKGCFTANLRRGTDCVYTSNSPCMDMCESASEFVEQSCSFIADGVCISCNMRLMWKTFQISTEALASLPID